MIKIKESNDSDFIVTIKGKRVTDKEAREFTRQTYGIDKMDDRYSEAMESFYDDPFELCSWMDGMEIRVVGD